MVDSRTNILSPEISLAVRAAFGDQPIDDLSVLKGGQSGAKLLSLRVAGQDYVLRSPDPARPMHDLRVEREIACMKIASDLGIAPTLRHVDAAACITIMEKIDGAPFGRGPRNVERLAGTLRRLHAGPAFPKGVSLLGMVRHFDEGLRAHGASGLPASVMPTLDDVSTILARFAETAPCHNDLNPGNILETPERIYFVDWETACAGDPYFDLAELGVFAFPAPDAREALLDAYLGRRPSAEERARATIARVMALCFYTVGFIHVCVAGGGSVELSASTRTIPEVLIGLSRGQVSPGTVAASLLEEMRREVESDAYEEAKRTLLGGAV